MSVLVLANCSASPRSQPSSPAASQPIQIFAAASLQASFDDLAGRFHTLHPDYRVAPIVYDGSQALATQITEGADVDVIAFANEASLKPVTKAGITDRDTIFATNTLQIAVAPGNPKHITDLADLTDHDTTVVMCAANVPCGTASQTLLEDAGVSVTPASKETNVRSVVTRVKNREADAGLVYATDVAAAGDALEGVTPSNADTAVNRYPIAVPKNAGSAKAAHAFVDFVLSGTGQKILRKYGFGQP